ncbi:hypothetical protein BGZ61DRAFT_450729 [Ilyonectria robusta]|uniref:uncharacterized protein n=1 Tax=Ilyonectria robusta TaxID=1079257 RepID=UPI001E8ECA1D|nr:uncharacterized protein BGZ61DRAFT_450729 [Ilyonectria robusta]KAH8699476.1 hypothetical protein BGZ61DRAFT_450729 [Ilyonectria robusta]
MGRLTFALFCPLLLMRRGVCMNEYYSHSQSVLSVLNGSPTLQISALGSVANSTTRSTHLCLSHPPPPETSKLR